MGLYLFNKFELKSQNENSDRQVPSQVTYCKEKKKLYCKNKPWSAACILLSSDS